MAPPAPSDLVAVTRVQGALNAPVAAGSTPRIDLAVPILARPPRPLSKRGIGTRIDMLERPLPGHHRFERVLVFITAPLR